MNTRLSLSVLAFIAAAIVAVIVTVGGGSKSQARTAAAASASISVKQTSLGKTLSDANGRTLYLFAPDKPNVSTLSAAGRAIWPPFTSSRHPTAIGGAQASQIGTVTGGGSPAQVTYRGHPLYYFAGDRKPGQTAGQGLNDFGGRWYVLSAAGGAITAAPTSTSSNGGMPSTSSVPAYSY
jgi:predicted lipoprotein with Yx(FWY)xxD motif